MHIFYSERHIRRDAKTELSNGRLVAPYECPARATLILDRLRQARLGEIFAPREFGLAPALRVHDADYVAFLESAWREWTAAGHEGEAIPMVWPTNRDRARRPEAIGGKLGYYALAADTSFTEGSWEAAQAAAQVALSGADALAQGGRAAFALCRPPGHHAARDLFGGYCFLNNAAIAARFLRDHGAARCAVLDVDFHHGNGTQDIFYHSGDVLFASLHGDPRQAFPYFSGYADETGAGAGEGANANYPLPRGAGWTDYEAALSDALKRIADFGADALVVSLGVDAFAGDPISFFTLGSADFTRMGERIGALRLPTLFVLEGGYAVAEIGINVVNALTGFQQA
ncbi:acetylpolyamine amidohydrolase [Rhodoblastus sphagnicola]|uniref:Acetylpolyamine amidohydrolase n=1 Tax=Rhodoblastus sphagnicola TaxID=333368 RepID=A0A2S6NFY9_9HYPH|nr:histone deacetylase family protein [Rhodoblastus sphagnicola]MBB4199464.1 acetoin utilization deacetylase AcuC-like enzyme [Rhodoblastus sphagnicola]PPQ33565.1 acetylpolyamine amidohydrolase [Rhodoblastus sphagnicola]